MRPSHALWLLLAILVSCQLGCVRRRLTIRSDPPGALVSIDQQEIGITPVSTDYIYYGSRNVVLQRDGYESVAVSRKFEAPWYQWPVIEFFTENLWPFELRDERELNFQLAPQQTVSTERLIQRGRDLRDSAQSGLVTPLPTTGQPPPNSLPAPMTSGFAPPPAGELITPP